MSTHHNIDDSIKRIQKKPDPDTKHIQYHFIYIDFK